jgi:hypothetical protein
MQGRAESAGKIRAPSFAKGSRCIDDELLFGRHHADEA